MTAETCPFCTKCELMRTSNQHAIAISDQRPISRGHTLIVARVHVPTIFDLPLPDYIGCFELVREAKDLVAKQYGAESFHVVVNCGSAANQTVLHAHIHLLPRYPGVNLPTSCKSWTEVV